VVAYPEPGPALPLRKVRSLDPLPLEEEDEEREASIVLCEEWVVYWVDRLAVDPVE